MDHIVALKEAYDSGAYLWSGARKSQFANDPLNQWCLAAGLNISKSDGDLAEWRGGSCGQRKHIASVTVQVKRKYSLAIDGAESRALTAALAAACTASGATARATSTPPAGSHVASAVEAPPAVLGRIVARRLVDGRTEFGFQTASGERVLPRSRYFPISARVGRWLNSSPVEIDGVAIGRINARLLADDRIEFAFTATNGERILPSSRYFPAGAALDRWLRSSEIDSRH